MAEQGREANGRRSDCDAPLCCERCGGAVAEDDNFCPACGEPLRAAEMIEGGSCSAEGVDGVEARSEGLPSAAAQEKPQPAHGVAAQQDSRKGARRKKSGRKAVAAAASLAVVAAIAAFAWAFVAGPMQPFEPREEGEAPNLAKALTMWQDPDKVVQVLGIGESQTSLKAMPGDLQKYGVDLGVWGQVYVAATNGAGDDLLGPEAGGVDDKTLQAASFEIERYPGENANGYPLVSDGRELHMLSVKGCYPFTTQPFGEAPSMSEFSTYGEVGAVQSGSVAGHSYPVLSDAQKGALEAATFATEDSAKAVNGFGEDEAMALLGDLGFGRDALTEGESYYFHRGFDAAVEGMLPDLEEGAASYAEYLEKSPAAFIPIWSDTSISAGYCWKGEAEVGGKTVHIRLRACNQAYLSLYCETAVMPGQYVLGQAGQDILVCCSLDEDGFSGLYGGGWFGFSQEAGYQTSEEPFAFSSDGLPPSRGREAGGGATGAPAESTVEPADIEGVWENDEMSYEFEMAAGNNAVGSVTLRQGEGSLSGDWKMGAPVVIDGTAYQFELTMGGMPRYASVSEDKQTLTINLKTGMPVQTFAKKSGADAPGAAATEAYMPKDGYLVVLTVDGGSWAVETRAASGGEYGDPSSGKRVVEGTVHDDATLVAEDGAVYSLEYASGGVTVACTRGATEITPVVEGTYLTDESAALAAA